MKNACNLAVTYARNLSALFLLFFLYTNLYAQLPAKSELAKRIFSTDRTTVLDKDPFGIEHRFIQNIGQYGDYLAGQTQMGSILYGYEGMGMPVLFTKKGFIQLQRKAPELTEEERERRERKGTRKEDAFEKMIPEDGSITMAWVNANPDVVIIPEEKTQEYHTYGMLPEKAVAFEKITYQDLYPGIDIEYLFSKNDQPGFEYRIILHPGADIHAVKMQFAGDTKKIKLTNTGLLVKTDFGGITQTAPVGFYADDKQKTIPVKFSLTGNTVGFTTGETLDSTRTLVIDPFVTATGNLLGLNAGKAKDVDFDYAGNIYVTGGGSYTTTHSLAKYDAAGVLQWTFNGTLTIPSWTFGTYYGGWMVEKPTGNIYLGQGFNFSTGFQVIRVSTTGLYDNYITTANQSFTEAWKMFWNCNNGSPQILIAGGGINSEINFGLFTPPATTVSSLNVTGIPYTGGTGWAQDIADFVFDPANNDMYTIYGSLIGTPSLGNMMYKNTAPYSAASIAWSLPSGYNTVSEAANRPYLVAGGLVDNSANMLYVNASYLYYWDGKNLKAFDKATGAAVGTPLTTANTAFMQGGIIVDACDNVFVGEANGNIKVYKFNGSTFNDAAAADITVAGFAGRHVYDLAYDEAKKLMYASGDGFVASFDISAYCPNTFYTINVVPNCATNTATATVSPTPPAGSTITYTLYTGAVQIAANTTGVFTGIIPNTTYKIIATINLNCSGAQASNTFTIPAPTINTTQVNTTCGNSTGSITATGSGTAGPFTYNINGGSYQASGTFNGLAAGVYTIIVKDAGGCTNTKVVTTLNSNGPSLTFTQVNADCGSNNATVTANATGGTAPYQFSINNGVTYQSGNFFTGLLPGAYILVVKDAAGCTNAATVTITSSPSPLITAIPAAATCGNTNGTITAFGSSGTGALQYSINGNIFQPGNTFTGLAPGAYTVTVKDANGCTNNVPATIANTPAPTITGTSTPAACSNINGSVTANGAGGVAPLQYSINGGAYQSSNIFTGLATGVYSISVKDATGCTNTVNVTVSSTNGPALTATTISSSCNASNGSITATASGGTPAYQYSIDGFTFQAGNTFTGLPAGSYIVYAKDALGCFAAFAVVITNTAGPLVSAVSTAASCSANDGSITAAGSGGTLPYQFSIDGFTFQVSNIFTGLAPNTTYTITIKDAGGCESTSTVAVNNASGLTMTVSSIAASCNNSIGVITATATGGAGVLQYSINGTVYQASNIFNGLAAGSYTVYVKDANGCIVTSPATVDAISSATISVTTTDETCNSANGIIEISGSGGVAPLTYSIDGSTYQSSGTFINIAAGNYTAYIKDGSGCVGTQDFTITNTGAGPGISTFTVTVKGAYLCNGGQGKITNPRVNGSNCGSCSFSLDGGAFIPNSTQLFLNVPPGTHTVTAMDAGGCTKTIIINMGIAVNSTASAVVTGTACNTSNGSITLTGIGPNTPYHASITGIGGPWVTFDPGTTFTGLAAGTYTIILSDDESFDSGPPVDPGGCLDTITVVVPSIGGPSLNIVKDNGTCALNDGTITASGSGGTPPLEYSIDGSTFQPTGDFTGLPSGTYNITVQDGTGCSNSQDVTITNPAGPEVTGLTASASCGLNNGTITATGTGGTPPLQYSLDGFAFQPGNSFTGLAAGNYNLYVKDAANCYSIIPLTITAAPLPKVTAFTIATTCNNNDGSIITTGSTGTSPYTYSINGTVFQSSNIFSGLPAGFYTVSIKGDRGCTSTTGITIGNIGAPTFTNTTVAAKCGNANGSIAVVASGGTPPYQYSSNGGTTYQPGNILTALAPGTYTVLVKDFNGCIASKAILVGNTNGPQTLTAVVVNAACGLSNGTITATATGGTAPLQYSRDGVIYQVSNTFSVPGGSYTLYVRDASLCIKTIPVTVLDLPGPALTAASSAASCGLNDGTITGTATGGTGLLTYSKDGFTFQASNIFLNLAAGPYSITVKDARGCSSTTAITVATIGATVTPTFNAVAAICSGAALAALPTTSLNGITGTWAPALNNTLTTTYTFTPTAGQCATTATLTITVNSNTTPTFNPVAAICSGAVLSALPTTSLNGITGTWAPALNNTLTTTYTFTPTAGQCATTATLTITVNSNTTPTFNPVAAICSGAALAALPTTSLNGITGTWAPALNNTLTTTYTFTPTAGQCATAATLTITVNSNTTPTFNPVAAICSGAALTALPTTSLNGITGTWAPALNNTLTTTYTFTPTAGQCATTATLTITVNSNTTPTFNPVAAICSGAALSALPTTSLNGITGTWAPALNNTLTTTYTFTPTAGQCATTATLTITVNSNTTPTFNPVAAICSGAALSALPTTSFNGITGTWAPALNNTLTTTYTFTPTAGQCATTATLTITVSPNTTPTFNPVAAICSGAALSALPTTSLNGITGTWAPALNNTLTTTYTFTPATGQCATTATLTVTVNPILNATINCGVSTTSSVIFTWAAVSGATGYTVSYQVNSGPAINIGTIGNLLSYQVNGLAAGDNVTITVTPTGGSGTCFNAANATCTATACTPPTANISYTGSFCASLTTTQPVSLTGTGTFTGGTFTAAPALSINSSTGAITPSLSTGGTHLVTYTVPASGGCPGVVATTSVTIETVVTPTFNPVAAICSGAALAALPTTSLNGITGTWAPALNNTLTTTYTFTPTAGQCATTATLTITVSPNTTPTFNPVAAICSGAALAALPTTSLNGITGTWAPALNNTLTTTYTFTPSTGQCAKTATLAITVNPNTTPTFNPIAAICSGTALTALPTTSLNGITGTWAPALNNTLTTTYTFTPTAGQCATTATLTITVNSSTAPTFNPVSAICSGAALAALPTTSLNGITGTWAPALNNTLTTTYTFTPTAGQCATTTSLTITVNSNTTPTFNPIAAICSGAALTALPTTSLNGITGTWAPALNNTLTTKYTFTPSAGQCATTATLTITVNPNITPAFNPIGSLCQNSTAPILPSASNNGITGTWNPATINTTTVGTNSYTFTPSPGQCANATTLSVIIATQISPVFTAIGPLCQNATAPLLPSTSNNGINGTWSPATISTGVIGTNTYTFTPATGQCATASMTISILITGSTTPTFNPVAAICSGDALAALPTTSLNGITGTWAPALNNTLTTTYTFTPTAGQCATTTTLLITVNPNVTPTFNPVAAICSGDALAALPTTSLNGITGTWAPALNNTLTTTYTFTPSAGQCATTTSLTITVNSNTTPTFNPVSAICSGAALAALPTTSLNGITGTWAPTLNNTSTTTYTFTPTAGQCATTTTLLITVNPNVTPTFNPVAAICSGDALAALPTTSLNGITGTWAPALNNVSTTTYTFTPTAGQCAATTALTITVNPGVTPVFNPIGSLCQNSTAPILPSASNNGITGTWNPAVINTATTGPTTYTFTPAAGQCATAATLTVTIATQITAVFTAIGPLCINSTAPSLPAVSNNGISGTWNPATINTAATGTFPYTFTPANGQCATAVTTLNITITTSIVPSFNPVAAICAGAALAPLPTTSLNGITGTWSPALNNNATTTYTFTPDAGQCASTSTLTITVTSAITPAFTAPGTLCQGTIAPALPSVSNNGITGTWSPATINTTTIGSGTYTFTPGAGQCATGTTMNVNIATQITPQFTAIGPLCQNTTAPLLPATSNNGINGTWTPATINTTTIGTNTYTFTPAAGQCATATVSIQVIVNGVVIPTFTPVATICAGTTLAALPTTSVNGITGVWSPALNNTATTNYTFTPAAGQCAAATTLTVTVTPASIPTFNPVPAICANTSLAALPTTSLNGITGAWTPALNNTATTTYTFTPTAGQCASVTTLTVTVTPASIPTFNPVAPICAGTTLAALPTTSLNGITGVWTPALNNTATTTYTFTPTAGQCAAATTLTVTVTPVSIPTFNPVEPICAGTTLAALPTTSLNGISGTWTPALNNTATTTYTFTPTAGQCAATATLEIAVKPAPVIFAGNDTIISINEPFTLHPVDVNNAGFTRYLWSPPDGLNNPFIQNPVAVLSNDATYSVTATAANGCDATDAINIRINRTAEIYVPSAFTPGGNNPLLHAIPVGIKTFLYFAVYNRWGQEVFRTSNPATGWDGIYKGKAQNSAGYVWIAEGIDFRNRVISRKGNVVLIR